MRSISLDNVGQIMGITTGNRHSTFVLEYFVVAEEFSTWNLPKIVLLEIEGLDNIDSIFFLPEKAIVKPQF